MKLLSMWALIASMAVIAITGCGGGGSDDTSELTVTTNSALTRDEFRQQANALCNEGKQESVLTLIHEAERTGKASAAEVPASFQAKSLLASLQTELSQLEGLGAPSGDEKQVEAVLVSYKGAIDQLEEKKEDFEKIEPARLGAELQPVFQDLYKATIAYGLKGCAYGH